MVDIDRFKRVNDEYGHDAGDHVLRAVAAEFEKSVLAASGCRDAIAARIGGEEFAALIPDVSADWAAALAETLCQKIRKSVFIACGKRITVTVSVGIAMRTTGEDFDTVMRRADDAVYAAKEGGRDGWQFAARRAAVEAQAA
jgi:diguanylate cyclase (GGDEF)-like protein